MQLKFRWLLTIQYALQYRCIEVISCGQQLHITALLSFAFFFLRLTGKVALITGAASGIGAETAKFFAHHGAKVVVADIQDDLSRSVVEDINAVTKSTTASFIHCDVTDEGTVRAAVDYAVSRYGKLDILFSNAGMLGGRAALGSILNADSELVKKTFEVNAVGAIHCAKHAARVMVGAKTRGSIIFTSSVASEAATINIPHAYTVSKSAVVGLTRGLAVELGKHGIRVNCVSPYTLATELAVEAFRLDRGQAEMVFEKAGNLKGVVLKENDVAEAVVYLASEESKYVSGINLVIDGGYSRANAPLA